MTPRLPELTDREETVLDLIADGFGMREIADRLGITEHTARKHRDNAVRSLAAVTQTQAVAILIRARSTATA